MPRLFTGIEIPATQTMALQMLQCGVPRAGSGSLRWIDPGDFHITLRFIGDVSPRMANDIVDALDRQTWQAPVIQMSELAAFGSKKPTSIHARVTPCLELTNMQAGQERLMQRLGLPQDARRFSPHVTLARCRNVKPETLARYLQQMGGFIVPPFTPSRFVLYSAKESRGGGPYRVEESWSLAQAGAQDANIDALIV